MKPSTGDTPKLRGFAAVFAIAFRDRSSGSGILLRSGRCRRAYAARAVENGLKPITIPAPRRTITASIR